MKYLKTSIDSMQAKLLIKHLALWVLVFISIGVLAQNNLANNPNAAYQPPVFEQNNRLENLQKLFPVVEKIYKNYAEKNHFPGYSFGIVLDWSIVVQVDLPIWTKKFLLVQRLCSA
jgi:hypothetical protein